VKSHSERGSTITKEKIPTLTQRTRSGRGTRSVVDSSARSGGAAFALFKSIEMSCFKIELLGAQDQLRSTVQMDIARVGTDE